MRASYKNTRSDLKPKMWCDFFDTIFILVVFTVSVSGIEQNTWPECTLTDGPERSSSRCLKTDEGTETGRRKAGVMTLMRSWQSG